MNISLNDYGLTERFRQEATMHEGLFIARVTRQHRELYKVISEHGEIDASVSGRLAYNATNQIDFPAVGDWVMLDRTDTTTGHAIIHHILRRKSVLARQAAGTENTGQVIAANIDTIFICMSLNADFNVRRIERYLTIAWDSMATPVIVLTKSDLCDDLPGKLAEIATVSLGTQIIVCSAESIVIGLYPCDLFFIKCTEALKDTVVFKEGSGFFNAPCFLPLHFGGYQLFQYSV